MSSYYTVMPPCTEAAFTKRRVGYYRGVKVSLEQVGDDNYRIEQILSTEPQDFAKKDVYPGLLLKM